MGIKAIFLDRDGTLNKTITTPDGVTHPPQTPFQMQLIPGAAEACATLRKLGYRLIVVSNQPDIARGTQSMEIVQKINAIVGRLLGIEDRDFFVCPHDSGDGCDCRKPKPGLLLQAAKRYNIRLVSSYMIGDRRTDVEAGNAAGCRSILIEDKSPDKNGNCLHAASLMGAVRWVQADLLLRRGEL